MRTKYYKKIITAGVALDLVGAPPADQVPQCDKHEFVIEFGAGTSAGAVVVESAARPDYTGVWVNLGTVTWSAASKAGSVSVVGNKLAIRARISVAIVGGSVDVHAQGLG